MSTLNERLDRIRTAFTEQATDAVQAIMHRATEDLRASGILSRVPAVGDSLPPFDLPDSEGTTVGSVDLLEQGPLVLGFYRGVW